jgi:hypothetical protein
MLASGCFRVEHLQVLRYAGLVPGLAVLAMFVIVAMIPFTLFLMAVRSPWWSFLLLAEAFVLPLLGIYLLAVSERY